MCAAPKGNQFWKLATKQGRDKIFATPEAFWKIALEYFEICDTGSTLSLVDTIKSGDNAGTVFEVPVKRPYSIEELCVYCNISRQTFLNYEKDENYKEFFEVFARVRDIIRGNQITGALAGAYKENIVARINGIGDRQNIVNEIPAPVINVSSEKARQAAEEFINKLKDE